MSRLNRLAICSCALAFICCVMDVGAQRPAERQAALQRMGRTRDAGVHVAAPGDDDIWIRYIPMHLKFRTAADCDKICAEQKAPFHVFLKTGEFADWLVEAGQVGSPDGAAKYSEARQRLNSVIEDLRDRREVLEWCDVESFVAIPPPMEGLPSTIAARGDTHVIRNGLDGFTGRGSIVAIVDTGVDFRHPDFQDDKGRSRIRWYWDTQLEHRPGRGQPGPFRYPNGTPIGTLFSREELTALIAANELWIGPRDLHGHGTSCAGVAVGNGAGRARAAAKDERLRAYDYTGVAPEADLIAIRVSDNAGKFNGSWLLSAMLKWLDEVAGASPLVVSCSFGGSAGEFDGARVQEEQIGRVLPSSKAGRVVCIAAGNEGDDGRHNSVTVTKDEPRSLRWYIPSQNDVTNILIVADADMDSVTVKPMAGSRVNQPTRNEKSRLYIRKHYDSNGKLLRTTRCETIRVQGSGGVRIESTSAIPVRVDAYVFDPNVVALEESTNRTQIGEPASADSIISVGSYNFNSEILYPHRVVHKKSVTGEVIVPGEMSLYSNGGFVRPYDKFGEQLRTLSRHVVKPELVAPGQWHVAAASSMGTTHEFDASYRYRRFNGTSAATPYTAGFVALLMQKNPQLSADRFRQLLSQPGMLSRTVRLEGRDVPASEWPNPVWGYGRLDAEAAKRIMNAWK